MVVQEKNYPTRQELPGAPASLRATGVKVNMPAGKPARPAAPATDTKGERGLGQAPRGIIFDCDGTLADSMPLHWRAWHRIAQRYGLALSEERFYSLGGVPARDILKLLCTEQGVQLDPLAVAREKEADYVALIAEVEPIHTVVAVARENYGKIPLAVASGGTRKIIEQVLERLGIRHLFQAIVSSEDVLHQKPAPDIFLEAARRIGVPPQFCRAYEDTDLGLQAIRAAGMEAVDVRELRSVKRGA
jgi:beta-phosphoglucomutase family hydrolase